MLLPLVRKEWLALLRDGHGLAALFVMPVLFIIVMSLALKDVYEPPSLRTLRHAFDVRDGGKEALQLRQLWSARHGAAVPLPPDWPAQLRSGRLVYVLQFDAGLSDELAQPALPTRPLIHLLTEPGIDGNLHQALLAELGATAGELKARLLLDTPGQPLSTEGSIRALVSAERYAGSGPRPLAVQQNVPAWLVFGMFFVVQSLAGLLIQERACGALARLQSLGVPRGILLASKALPYLAVNAVQAALMLAVGVWLMPRIGGDALSLQGIHWPALLLALGAIAAAAVSMALALACLVRSHAQAAAVGPIVNVLMAAIGGVMVPTFLMPVFMQRLSAFSPMNWGLEALLTVLLRGGGLAETLPDAARLGGFALLMGLLAFMLFPRVGR